MSAVNRKKSDQLDIIRMAKECGIGKFESDEHWIDVNLYDLQAFAALVAAHEREACAKVCNGLAELNRTEATDSMWQWEECAAAIRARGK